MGKLLEELKRRKVVQVAAAYAITSWLVIQIVTSVEAPLNLPDWVDTLVIVMLGIGFPMALVLSWAFDFTADGVKPAVEAAALRQSAQVSTPPFSLALQVLILVAVGFLIFDQYLSNDNQSVSLGEANPSPSTAVTRFALDIESTSGVNNTNTRLAISPAGDSIVFRDQNSLYLREMDSLDSRLILESTQSLNSPVFSPDGETIVYWAQGDEELKRIAITGGAPVTLAQGVTNPFGISWSADGALLYGQPDGVYRISNTADSIPELIIPNPLGLQIFGPQLLPDGDTILYSASKLGDWDAGQVIAHSLSTGVERILLEGGNRAKYIAAGYLVYALGNNLYGISFDASNGAVSGQPVLLEENVARASRIWNTGAAHFDVSDNGTMIFQENVDFPKNEIVWVDRAGVEKAIALPVRSYNQPRISPDGTQLLINEQNADKNDIWIWHFQRETQTRLTLGDFGGDYAIWSADGDYVAYHPSTGELIDWRTSNNVGAPERLVSGAELNFGAWHPEDFSSAGTEMVFHGRATTSSEWDLGVAHIGDSIEIEWLIAEPFNQWHAQISPNGRWIAYESDESGRTEIQVRPFPNVDANRWTVSSRGGVSVRWSEDGSELYFLEPGEPNRLISTQILSDEFGITFGELEEVMAWPYSGSFDVASDGQRFIGIKRVDDASLGPQIIVVQNWFEEIKVKIGK